MINKSGVIFAVIGFIIFLFCEAWGADWEPFFYADSGSVFYYDRENITRPSKDVVRVSMKHVLSEKDVTEVVARWGKKYRALSNQISLLEIQCVDKKVNVLSTSRYSQDGEILNPKDPQIPRAGPIVPDSAGEALYEVLCKMASDRSKPTSFAIGPYKLDMSIVGLKGLVEITPAQYDVLPKTFKGEKIFKAPDVSFLRFSWDMMLGVVQGKIYKISPSLVIPDKRQADEATIKVLAYCKSKFGEPVEQQPGLFMWDTSDGNVILQKPLETPFGFVINLFVTSRAVRSYKPLN
jgi:hypothetical protein